MKRTITVEFEDYLLSPEKLREIERRAYLPVHFDTPLGTGNEKIVMEIVMDRMELLGHIHSLVEHEP